MDDTNPTPLALPDFELWFKSYWHFCTCNFEIKEKMGLPLLVLRKFSRQNIEDNNINEKKRKNTESAT